jgi:peptide/nickel transport system permease protein
MMSMVAFFLIQLPPGDYVSFRITQMRMSGVEVSDSDAELLKREFGLDQPTSVRYFRWVSGIVTKGYWGRSLQWNKPVHEILAERVPMTMLISFLALIFSWAIALPMGIFSATRQYSVMDYIITFLGFIGMATPGFLIALILAYIAFSRFGFSALGLFSQEYVVAPWSVARVIDLLKHLSGCRWSWWVLRTPGAPFVWCAITCWMSCTSSMSLPRAPKGCRNGNC